MGVSNYLSEQIRVMRKSRKMTQADLAKAIGQSPSSITMYETGRREPDFETLEALADVFNVPLISFIPVATEEEELNIPERPITKEARIISGGIDKMPPERREQALRILQAAFTEFADYFKEDRTDDT